MVIIKIEKENKKFTRWKFELFFIKQKKKKKVLRALSKGKVFL